MMYIIEKHDRVEIDTNTFTIEYWCGTNKNPFSKEKEDSMRYANKEVADGIANTLRKEYPTSLIEVVEHNI